MIPSPVCPASYGLPSDGVPVWTPPIRCRLPCRGRPSRHTVARARLPVTVGTARPGRLLHPPAYRTPAWAAAWKQLRSPVVEIPEPAALDCCGLPSPAPPHGSSRPRQERRCPPVLPDRARTGLTRPRATGMPCIQTANQLCSHSRPPAEQTHHVCTVAPAAGSGPGRAHCYDRIHGSSRRSPPTAVDKDAGFPPLTCSSRAEIMGYCTHLKFLWSALRLAALPRAAITGRGLSGEVVPGAPAPESHRLDVRSWTLPSP